MPWVWERKKLNNRLQSRFFYFYSSNHRLLSKRFTLKLFNRNVMFVLNVVFQERCSWKRRKKMFMFLFLIEFNSQLVWLQALQKNDFPWSPPLRSPTQSPSIRVQRWFQQFHYISFYLLKTPLTDNACFADSAPALLSNVTNPTGWKK